MVHVRFISRQEIVTPTTSYKKKSVAKSKPVPKPKPKTDTSRITQKTTNVLKTLYAACTCVFGSHLKFANLLNICFVTIDRSHIIPRDKNHLLRGLVDIINDPYNILPMSRPLHQLFELQTGRPFFSLCFKNAFDSMWDIYEVEFNLGKSSEFNITPQIEYIIKEFNGNRVKIHRNSRKFIALHYAICFNEEFPATLVTFPYAKCIYNDLTKKDDRPPPKLPEGFFEVEKILDTNENDTEYLIKWAGYDDSENSWIDKRLVNKAAIKEYTNRNKMQTGSEILADAIAERKAEETEETEEIDSANEDDSDQVVTEMIMTKVAKQTRHPRAAHSREKIVYSGVLFDKNGKKVPDGKQGGMYYGNEKRPLELENSFASMQIES